LLVETIPIPKPLVIPLYFPVHPALKTMPLSKEQVNSKYKVR